MRDPRQGNSPPGAAFDGLHIRLVNCIHLIRHQHLDAFKHAVHPRLNDEPRSEQGDLSVPARTNLLRHLLYDVYEGNRRDLFELAYAEMRSYRRDGRDFRSAPREPIDQAREILSQPEAVPPLDVSQHTIHVRMDNQHLAGLRLDQFPVVVNRRAGGQPSDQSPIPPFPILATSCQRHNCPNEASRFVFSRERVIAILRALGARKSTLPATLSSGSFEGYLLL